jgi:hypothetical protein
VGRTTASGITILSPPRKPEYSHTETDFPYLKGDEGTKIELEDRHLDAISKSHFLYVVNTDGHLGMSALIETGFALSKNVPIYSAEPFGEEIWESKIRSGKTAEEIKSIISKAETGLIPVHLRTVEGQEDRFRALLPSGLFFYIENAEGTLTKTMQIKIGWALGKGIPVYTSNPLKDAVWDQKVKSGMTVEEIKGELSQRAAPRTRIKA